MKMNKDAKKLFVKNNAEFLNAEYTANEINNFGIKELDELISEINNNPSFIADDSADVEEVVLNGTDTFVTDKGVQVPIVEGIFVKRNYSTKTDRSSFIFETPIGKITTSNYIIAQAFVQGKIAVGDKVVFNAQSLQQQVYPSGVVLVEKKRDNSKYGAVLMSANPMLLEQMNSRKESIAQKSDERTALLAQGFKKVIVDELLDGEEKTSARNALQALRASKK